MKILTYFSFNYKRFGSLKMCQNILDAWKSERMLLSTVVWKYLVFARLVTNNIRACLIEFRNLGD